MRVLLEVHIARSHPSDTIGTSFSDTDSKTTTVTTPNTSPLLSNAKLPEVLLDKRVSLPLHQYAEPRFEEGAITDEIIAHLRARRAADDSIWPGERSRMKNVAVEQLSSGAPVEDVHVPGLASLLRDAFHIPLFTLGECSKVPSRPGYYQLSDILKPVPAERLQSPNPETPEDATVSVPHGTLGLGLFGPEGEEQDPSQSSGMTSRRNRTLGSQHVVGGGRRGKRGSFTRSKNKPSTKAHVSVEDSAPQIVASNSLDYEQPRRDDNHRSNWRKEAASPDRPACIVGHWVVVEDVYLHGELIFTRDAKTSGSSPHVAHERTTELRRTPSQALLTPPLATSSPTPSFIHGSGLLSSAGKQSESLTLEAKRQNPRPKLSRAPSTWYGREEAFSTPTSSLSMRRRPTAALSSGKPDGSSYRD